MPMLPSFIRAMVVSSKSPAATVVSATTMPVTSNTGLRVSGKLYSVIGGVFLSPSFGMGVTVM